MKYCIFLWLSVTTTFLHADWAINRLWNKYQHGELYPYLTKTVVSCYGLPWEKTTLNLMRNNQLDKVNKALLSDDLELLKETLVPALRDMPMHKPKGQAFADYETNQRVAVLVQVKKLLHNSFYDENKTQPKPYLFPLARFILAKNCITYDDISHLRANPGSALNARPEIHESLSQMIIAAQKKVPKFLQSRHQESVQFWQKAEAHGVTSSSPKRQVPSCFVLQETIPTCICLNRFLNKLHYGDSYPFLQKTEKKMCAGLFSYEVVGEELAHPLDHDNKTVMQANDNILLYYLKNKEEYPISTIADVTQAYMGDLYKNSTTFPSTTSQNFKKKYYDWIKRHTIPDPNDFTKTIWKSGSEETFDIAQREEIGLKNLKENASLCSLSTIIQKIPIATPRGNGRRDCDKSNSNSTRNTEVQTLIEDYLNLEEDLSLYRRTLDVDSITPHDVHWIKELLYNKAWINVILSQLCSYKTAEEGVKIILRKLKAHYYTQKNSAAQYAIEPIIIIVPVAKQQDSTSCGTHAIKNAFCIIKNNRGGLLADIQDDNSPLANTLREMAELLSAENDDDTQQEDVDSQMAALISQLDKEEASDNTCSTRSSRSGSALSIDSIYDEEIKKLADALGFEEEAYTIIHNISEFNSHFLTENEFERLCMIIHNIHERIPLRHAFIIGNMYHHRRSSNEEIGKQAGSFGHWVTIVVEVNENKEVIFHCANSAGDGTISEHIIQQLRHRLQEDIPALRMLRELSGTLPDYSNNDITTLGIANDIFNALEIAQKKKYAEMPQFYTYLTQVVQIFDDMVQRTPPDEADTRLIIALCNTLVTIEHPLNPMYHLNQHEHLNNWLAEHVTVDDGYNELNKCIQRNKN